MLFFFLSRSFLSFLTYTIYFSNYLFNVFTRWIYSSVLYRYELFYFFIYSICFFKASISCFKDLFSSYFRAYYILWSILTLILDYIYCFSLESLLFWCYIWRITWSLYIKLSFSTSNYWVVDSGSFCFYTFNY